MDSEKELHDTEHAVSHDHQSMLLDRLQNMNQKHQHPKETSPFLIMDPFNPSVGDSMTFDLSNDGERKSINGEFKNLNEFNG